MRIGIEADRMWANQFGIGRFVRQTVASLQTAYPEHEYTLFSLTRVATLSRRAYSPIRLLRGMRRIVWLHTHVPREAARQRLDVLLCPDYLTPLRVPCPIVTVVHDVLFHRYPDWGERMVNWQLRLCVPTVIRRAACVVTPSESSREDVIRLLRCPAEKVEVIPEGVDRRFVPLDREHTQSILAKYGLAAASYLLSVGMWSPRKNLIRLLQAFAQLRSWYDGQLVLVGGGGWSQQPLREVIAQLDLSNRVMLTGFVPDEDLPAFYSGADLFMFPSLYEGFGLPPLEAMACGCPVIASNASSIPEVTRGAAILVDPYDVTGLAQAMRDLLQDEAMRARLRTLGLTRARDFSWTTTAQHFERIFRRIASS